MQTSEKRAFKNQLYEQFARIGKALASPHRLELLDVLAQCERTVEALAQETGMSIANASQHLQVLRTAHLVEVRREGTSLYYRLASEGVSTLWLSLRQVGEAHLAEVDRVVETFLRDRHLLQPIQADELLHRLSKDEVMKLVWSDATVEEGNIARNISTLRNVLGERPRERARERQDAAVPHHRAATCALHDYRPPCGAGLRAGARRDLAGDQWPGLRGRTDALHAGSPHVVEYARVRAIARRSTLSWPIRTSVHAY